MLTNSTLPGLNRSSDLSDMGDALQWNKVVKLLLLSTMSAVGTVGNIFAISAIMLENQLKKRGNVFIVNLAIADFIVSAFAIPASSITILAGIPDNLDVCSFQWVSAVLCCHVSVLSLAFIAAENYCRVCRPQTLHARLFTKARIIFMVAFVWTVSTVCVTLQFALGWGPDYCRMRFIGNATYHMIVGTVLFILPTALAFVCYMKAIVEVRIDSNKSPDGSPSSAAIAPPSPPQHQPESPAMTLLNFEKDYALLKTNLLVFFVFLVFWLPLGISMAMGASGRLITRRVYENVSWLALSNSCVNSFIYGLSNKHFRSAYYSLFHYCCCKTSVSFNSRRPRPDAGRPHSDVRVHIFSGYGNMCAVPPGKPETIGGGGIKSSASASAKTVRMTAPKVKASKAKDVYEL